MTRGETLLGIARRALETHFERTTVERPANAPWLDEKRAVFVTLAKRGELRGCVGQIKARLSLFDAVIDAAIGAAFDDTRFTPVDASELPALHIEISVLSALERLDVHSEQETLEALRVGIDGVLLTCGFHSAVFIPEMWKELPDPKAFLWQLRRKGQLPLEHWPDELTVDRFTAERFEEPTS